MRRSDFARKSLHTYATKIVLLGSDFILGVMITRLLGPEGRGIVSVAGASAGLISQFGLFGLHNANTCFVAKQRLSPSVLLGNSLLLAALIAFGAVFVIVGVSHFQPSMLPLSLTMLGLMWLAIPIQALQSLVPSVLLGLQEVYAGNRIELVTRGAQLGLLAILLAGGVVSPEAVFLTGVLVGAAGVALGVRVALRHTTQRVRASWPAFKESLGYGFKSYLAALFSFAVLRLDLLLISYLLGVAEAGLYAVAITLISAIFMLPTTLAQLAFARLSALSDWQEKVQFATRVAAVSGLLMLVLVLPLWAFADPLFLFVYGSDFAHSAGAFVWLLPGVLVWSVEGVLRKLYTSDGYASWVVTAWGMALLCNLLANLWLIPIHGIEGAAIASSLSLAVVGAWTLSVYLRDLVALRRYKPTSAGGTR